MKIIKDLFNAVLVLFLMAAGVSIGLGWMVFTVLEGVGSSNFDDYSANLYQGRLQQSKDDISGAI